MNENEKKKVVSTLSWATDGFACFRSFFHTAKVVLTITGTGGTGGLWSNGVVLISSGFPLHTTANQLTTQVITAKIMFI